MEQVKHQLAELESMCENVSILKKIEEKTKVKKSHQVLGVGGVLLVLTGLGWGGELICNLLGFLYPAYKSFQTVQSDNKLEDTKWLSYWVIYAAFVFLEIFSEFILSYLPFYWLLKFVFLLWLLIPATNGIQIIYNRVFSPYLLISSSPASHTKTD